MVLTFSLLNGEPIDVDLDNVLTVNQAKWRIASQLKQRGANIQLSVGDTVLSEGALLSKINSGAHITVAILAESLQPQEPPRPEQPRICEDEMLRQDMQHSSRAVQEYNRRYGSPARNEQGTLSRSMNDRWESLVDAMTPAWYKERERLKAAEEVERRRQKYERDDELKRNPQPCPDILYAQDRQSSFRVLEEERLKLEEQRRRVSEESMLSLVKNAISARVLKTHPKSTASSAPLGPVSVSPAGNIGEGFTWFVGPLNAQSGKCGLGRLDAEYSPMLEGILPREEFDNVFKGLNDISVRLNKSRDNSPQRQCLCCCRVVRDVDDSGHRSAIEAYLEHVNASQSHGQVQWSLKIPQPGQAKNQYFVRLQLAWSPTPQIIGIENSPGEQTMISTAVPERQPQSIGSSATGVDSIDNQKAKTIIEL